MCQPRPKPCDRCGKVVQVRRGLCKLCFRRAKINNDLPPPKNTGPKSQEDRERSLTEAELDLIISEQLDNLPPWWDDEVRKQNDVERILGSGPQRLRIRVYSMKELIHGSN